MGAPVGTFSRRLLRAPSVPAGVRRLLTVGLAATVALGLGYVTTVEQVLQLATGTLLLLGGVLFIARQLAAPTTGLMLLLLTAVLAPLVITRGLSACLLLAVFLSAQWIAAPVIFQRAAPLTRSRVVTAAFVFIAVAVLAFLSGLYPWFPSAPAPMVAQVGGLALFVVSALLFLTVGHEIRSVRDLERLTWLFLGAGGVLVLAMLPFDLPGFATVRRVADTGTVGSLFWVWLVAMSFGQALCNSCLDARLRLAALAIGLVALARGVLLAFSWASGWLPPLMALGVILLIRFPRFTFSTALLLIAPLLLASEWMLAAVMDNESYSWMTRLEAWLVVFDMIKANPLLGFGPANYYHYTPLFPILGWWVSFNSHNNYLDLVAQTGALGLLAFLWFAYENVKLNLRLWSRAPVGFPRSYTIAVLGGLAGSLTAGFLGDWIIPFAYNVGLPGFRSSLLFWFFLGGLLALYRLTANGPYPRGRQIANASAV